MTINSTISSASDAELLQMLDIIRDEIKRRRKLDKHRSKKSKVPAAYSDLSKEAILKANAVSLLAIPAINQNFSQNNQYFKSILDQDWSSVYPSDTSPYAGDYYVYAHVDPTGKKFFAGEGYGGDYNGKPFYIGKGSGGRAFDLKRNQGHGKRIRQLISDGWRSEDIVHIIFNSLSEAKAFELEAKLIYIFGTIYQKERRSAFLVNLEIPKTPEFKGFMTPLFPKRKKSVEGKVEENSLRKC